MKLGFGVGLLKLKLNPMPPLATLSPDCGLQNVVGYSVALIPCWPPVSYDHICSALLLLFLEIHRASPVAKE